MTSSFEPEVTLLPEVTCPCCESMLDAASPSQEGQGGPAPGDVSLCFYCGAFLEFDENMKAIRIHEATIASLAPEVTAELLRLQVLIQGYKTHTLH